MATLRIGQAVEFKAKPGLGGWTRGTVTGFVGKLIEVRGGWDSVRPETGEARFTHAVPPSRIRPSREETKPDRGAQQAAARAQRLVMAPPPMDTEEPEEVIPRDVEPVAVRAVYPGTGAARSPVFAPQPKAVKPTRSQAYRRWVLMQPCATSGKMAEDAHHYGSQHVARGTSTKVSDFYCVPLTHRDHMAWHSLGYVPGVLEMERDSENPRRMATRIAFLEAALKSLVGWLERQDKEDE